MTIEIIKVKQVRLSRAEADDIWKNFHTGKAFFVDGRRILEYHARNDGHRDIVLLEGELFYMELVPY